MTRVASTTKKTAEPGAQNWSRFDAMTAEERHAAALADPDSQRLTPEDFRRMRATPRAKIIRRALGLSQEDFAAQFHIPLGTVRDWEQGRKEPDAAARAFLVVIAREPETVERALAAGVFIFRRAVPQRSSVQLAQQTRCSGDGIRCNVERFWWHLRAGALQVVDCL